MNRFNKEHIGKHRPLPDVQAAAAELSELVWYNQHRAAQIDVEEGRVKIVDKPAPGKGQTEWARDNWEGAELEARAVEKKYGLENLGPWTDFEWGQIYGRRLALMWVMGEEWDGGGLGV